MKKTLILIGIITTLELNNVYAQKEGQARIDSLLTELSKAKEDSNKVKLLTNLCFSYYTINPDKGIEYGKQGLELAEKLGWKKGMAFAYNDIGTNYVTKSNYPKAIEYFLKALKLNEELGNKRRVAINLGNIANIYLFQSEYPKALEYYLKAFKLNEEIGNRSDIALTVGNIGIVYLHQSNYPKSLDFFLKALKLYEYLGDKSGIARNLLLIGNLYYDKYDYAKALEYKFKSLKIYEELDDKNGIASNLNGIGNVYNEQCDYPKALEYTLKSLKLNKELGNMSSIGVNLANVGGIYLKAVKDTTGKIYELFFKGSTSERKKLLLHQAKLYTDSSIVLLKETEELNLLSEKYDQLSEIRKLQGNFKEAYNAYVLYKQVNDSVFNIEKDKKLTQITMQYDFDKKEAATKAETDKKEALAKSEISKQKIIRNSIAGGTGILVISSIFSFLFYKRKREASFKNEVSEVEMKALRSQMNPHFIFNSLNSIKRYMANHDNKTAEDYLTKFASVMRMILENSEHKEVPLEQDLKALELYMQLESLRMKKKFNYEIKVDENIDTENTLIPPLILQPFVENSIWHGLAEKEGEGKITISINKIGEMIECTVEDNGVGRKKSEEVKGGYAQIEKKSLGMKITNARIDILNKIKKSKAGVELVDLAEGMKVVVRLPLELSF